MNRNRKDSDIICSHLRCFLDFSAQSSIELICNGRGSIPLCPHSSASLCGLQSSQHRAEDDLCVKLVTPSVQNRERKPVHPGQWQKALPIAQNHLLNHRATSTGCNKERGCAGSGQGESWRTRDDCVVVHFF